MIAIVVHQMITISAKLIAQLFDDSSDLFICKICTANLNTLPKTKLFAKFVMITRLYLKNTRKRKRMAAVGEFCAKNLNTRMKNAQANARSVLIDPVHIVDIQNDSLTIAHIVGWQQFIATAVLWHTKTIRKWYVTGQAVRKH